MNNNPLIGTKRFPNGYTWGVSTTPNDIYSKDVNNNPQDIKTNSTKNSSTIQEKYFDLFKSKSPKRSEGNSQQSVFFQEDCRNFYRDLLNKNNNKKQKNKIQDKKNERNSLNKNKNGGSDKDEEMGGLISQKHILTKQKERKKCVVCARSIILNHKLKLMRKF